MLDNLILIENGKYYQFSDENELVKKQLGNNYYYLSREEKEKLIKVNAIMKCIGTDLEILKVSKDAEKKDIKNKFIIYDEKTYILSVLLTNKVTLLEKNGINIYTDNLDKSNINDNYIIVNNFAEELLKSYLGF